MNDDQVDHFGPVSALLAGIGPDAVESQWPTLCEALWAIADRHQWNYIALLCLASRVEDGWLRPSDPQYIDTLVYNHRINDALYLTQYLRMQTVPNAKLRRLRLLGRRWNFPGTDRWVSSDDLRRLVIGIVRDGKAVDDAGREPWMARELARRLKEFNDRLKDGALMQMMRHAGALNGMQWRRLTKDTKSEVAHIRLHAASSFLTTTIRVGSLTRRVTHLLPLVAMSSLSEAEHDRMDSHFGLRRLGRQVFDLLTAIQDRQSVAELLPTLQKFYDLLIAPLFAKAGVADAVASLGPRPTLSIITHGALAQLPFAALHDGGGYLVERFNVVQSPPLFPAVDFATGDLDWEALWGGEPIPNPSPVRGLFDTVGLDHAATEGHNLHRHFGETAKIDTGLWTLETLRWLTRERGLAFLSTHVRPSDEGGGRTAVVTPTGEELTFGEAMTEPMAADLLVLAGCVSTGQSDWLSDGETSLVSLYRRAGVQAVISTLWPVSDTATPLYSDALMAAFAAGRSRAQAHGEAQLVLMRSAGGVGEVYGDKKRLFYQPTPLPEAIAVESRMTFDHPYFWAAFTLSGAWR